MLAGRADAPDATLLRALAAAQLDAATRPTISFLHVSAAGGGSSAGQEAEEEEGARGAVRSGGVR